MKQELIKRLNACCMLTFPLMMAWIDALIFPNDSSGSFKSWLKAQIKPNGELPNSAWLLLLQNAEFEANSPITSAVAVGWLTERTCPTRVEIRLSSPQRSCFVRYCFEYYFECSPCLT